MYDDVRRKLDANLAVLRTSVRIAERIAHLDHVDRSDSSAPHRHPTCDKFQAAIDAVHGFMEDGTAWETHKYQEAMKVLRAFHEMARGTASTITPTGTTDLEKPLTADDLAQLLERLNAERVEAGQRITAARAALAQSKRNNAPAAVLADALAGVKLAEAEHTRIRNDLEIVERAASLRTDVAERGANRV
jgi:hypothetical protein